jgi:HD-GYP domain-containing protein (c-di-GMP phosphodiesterase class II)
VLIPSERSPSLFAVALLVVLYAVTFRFEFEVGTGVAVPTQLFLVPMLFLLPTGWVPLAVAAGIILGSLTSYFRAELRLGRVFVRVVNAWHAVGPALVLGLAGEGPPNLKQWPLYVAALAAQFLIDFGLAPVGLAVAFASQGNVAGVLLALPLVVLLRVFSQERKVRIDHELELRDAYRGTAFLLGDVIEADDAYTGTHSRDVVDLTLSVADELGLSARQRRDAEFAALLHDVGKVRIPNEIINKAGPLTDEERKIIERHTIEGEQMLLRVGGLLGKIGRIVRACHERWDGTGYPDGIAGEQIPIIARIVCCCDAFNAMTSDRSYRKALPLHEAVAELKRMRGTQFDPSVVDALIAAIQRQPLAA